MAVNSFSSNQGTQSALLTDNTGGASGTLIPVMKLSIDAQGTFTNGGLWNGSITGLGTLPGIGSVSNIGSIGMLNAGTISSLPNLPGGSIAITTGTVNTGTINIGTVVGKDASGAARTGNPIPAGGTDGGGTIYGFLTDTKGQQYLGGGTVSMLNAGTLTTIPNIPGGTLGLVSAIGTIGTLGLGTITGNLGTMGTLGTVQNIGSITNIGQVYNAGTLQTGANTIGNIGTLQVGTINTGTVVAQANPLPAVNTITHAGTSGTLGIGTLVAAVGSGTAIYPTRFSVVAISGTPEVILAFGSQTNGPQVIHHGLYPAGGGIAMPIHYPNGYGTTNSPLTYQILSGAGTVSWDVDYFAHT